MCKLLDKYSKINNISFGKGSNLRYKDSKFQNSTAPMNDLYWMQYRLEKALNWQDFKYVEYEDINMMRIKKFKKGG